METMISVDRRLCTGCAMCVPCCPEEVISCFGLAGVDDGCTACLGCVGYCPVGALREKEVKEVPRRNE